MTEVRRETDSLGVVEVPADKLWGAQTQRSLQHFSIGQDLMPREMITAYAILKMAAANANHAGGRLAKTGEHLTRGSEKPSIALQNLILNEHAGDFAELGAILPQ